jgi:hypothetical protein
MRVQHVWAKTGTSPVAFHNTTRDVPLCPASERRVRWVFHPRSKATIRSYGTDPGDSGSDAFPSPAGQRYRPPAARDHARPRRTTDHDRHLSATPPTRLRACQLRHRPAFVGVLLIVRNFRAVWLGPVRRPRRRGGRVAEDDAGHAASQAEDPRLRRAMLPLIGLTRLILARGSGIKAWCVHGRLLQWSATSHGTVPGWPRRSRARPRWPTPSRRIRGGGPAGRPTSAARG